MRRRLLYFCPATRGGIADYAREQASAIAETGVDVDLLAAGAFKLSLGCGVRLVPRLGRTESGNETGQSRLRSRLRTVRRILDDMRSLAQYVVESRCQHILFASYAEYLAPIWARRLRKLSGQGHVFGAVVHDPVRDAVIGPLWWHKWSTSEGYSFLREAFLHEPADLDAAHQGLRKTVIPHGVYSFPAPTRAAAVTRRELAIPDGVKVLLAFGHIRDNKRLDLTIRTMSRFPDVYLLVVGSPLNAKQRPMSFYRELANEHGVAGRCRWIDRYVPDAEVGNYFQAANAIVLTYSREFRSASGVLNLAVAYRRPCIAASGPSNMRRVVNQYRLGVWVEPDSEQSLACGLREWVGRPVSPDWDEYERDNCWSQNARVVIGRLFDQCQETVAGRQGAERSLAL